jgi:hypothetical protein
MRKLLGVAVVVAMTMTWTGSAMATTSVDDQFYPPDSSPGGLTLGEWQGLYQVWLTEIPTGQNPLYHPDSPRNCELQPGNVVFLGASGSDCTIPAGAAVAFSTAFWECSTAEGLGNTWRALRHCAVDNFRHDFSRATVGLTMKVDGRKLLNRRRWTSITPGEIIRFPKNNIWGADPGKSKSVTKGLFYVMKPMVSGDHHIRLHVNDANLGTFNIDWWLHVA